MRVENKTASTSMTTVGGRKWTPLS